jgi:LDH2 family malate/lactate/ureidoglycolate dehydrogenase
VTSVSVATVPDSDLRAFLAAVLERTGYTPADASEIADALVEADLRGIVSHGTMHLPNLVKRTKLGLVNTRPHIRTLSEAAASARLDADRAPGFIAAARAMDLAIQKARAAGAAAVAVTNSTHYGMGARYAERAARSGMIGIALANATATMPSPGGTQALIGTNPISFAIPGDRGDAVMCLDMGLGQVTLNSVRDAAKRGRVLPEGVAAANDGTPTTDPAKMLDGGFLLPFGGHKGFVDYDRPQNTGHFVLAVDVTHFLSLGEFRAKRDFLISWIKESSRATGAGPALLPGEREHETRRERLRSGIPLPKETAADLATVGRESSVAVPRSIQDVAA